MSNWTIKKLSEIVSFNPRETIKRGTLAKKIAMDTLVPFCRDVPSFEITEFNGGTKFRNGDTIMARITPCLENGKTAKINILGDNEVGFGSTEFIVFRAIEGLSNEDYVYYLVCSPIVRESAIKSMVGSSGRQRVQTDVLKNLEICVPDLETQVKIGLILKSIDDKITINKKINENLEQQAQAIFKSWFVDFEPFGGIMPDDWRMGSLSEICKYSKDRVCVEELSLDTYYSTENMQPNRQGAVQATTLPSIKQTTACKKGDVLISNIRPYFKKIIYCFADCGCSTDVLCFVPNRIEYSAFLYCALYSDKFFAYMVAGSKGTKMPRGDKQQIMKYPICIPSAAYIEKFNKAVRPMLETIHTNRLEANNLAILRDTLLPKLMNGEIDVSEVQI